MLILPRSLSEPVKNRHWQIQTPNEKYFYSDSYQAQVSKYAVKNGVPVEGKFVEVRVVKQASKLDLEGSTRWWDHPVWMDKVFWVFRRPLNFYPDGKNYQCYLLEPLESRRVVTKAIELLGHNPFQEIEPGIVIPVDVCQQVLLAETSGGISDHIRYRETPLGGNPVELDPEEVDKQVFPIYDEKGEDIKIELPRKN